MPDFEARTCPCELPRVGKTQETLGVDLPVTVMQCGGQGV